MHDAFTIGIQPWKQAKDELSYWVAEVCGVLCEEITLFLSDQKLRANHQLISQKFP
jgi:hypothetical protein